jgi:transcriptional regulator with XRE-family HTH domain
MKNAVTSIFADRLQDLIAESGKTINELSSPDEIGISSGSLSKYQNDVAEPGITALVKLADYFNVSFDYLLGKSDCKHRENIDIREETMLSEKAIELLKYCKGRGDKHGDNSIAQTVSVLLEEEDTLDAIRQYLFYELCEEVAPFHTKYKYYKKDTAKPNDGTWVPIDFESVSRGLTSKHFQKIKMLEIQECLMKLPEKVNLEECVMNGDSTQTQ